jgi:hypothetical protein
MSQATEPIFCTAITVEVPIERAFNSFTRVELEHSNLDCHGTDWPQLQAGISNPEGGWPGLLLGFAKAAQ